MTYQWKLKNLYPVSAQTAGEELNRIFETHGKLDPADIVEKSRSESAPLHSCFEWNDAVAAEKYREVQAGDLVRAVVTVVEQKNSDPATVRAFVNVENTYQPINIVIKNEDKSCEMLTAALKELQAFKTKYETLQALRPVFTAIEAIVA